MATCSPRRMRFREIRQGEQHDSMTEYRRAQVPGLGGRIGRTGTCTVNRGPGDQIGRSFYTDPNTGEKRYQGPIDPLLLHLSQNGGPTPTHALLAGSPAIDAGTPRGMTAGRSVVRPAQAGPEAPPPARYRAPAAIGKRRGWHDKNNTEKQGHGPRPYGPSSHRGKLNVQFTPRRLAR